MFSIDLFLQIWGGICYLLAKVLLAAADGMNNGKKTRIGFTTGNFTYCYNYRIHKGNKKSKIQYGN